MIQYVGHSLHHHQVGGLLHHSLQRNLRVILAGNLLDIIRRENLLHAARGSWWRGQWTSASSSGLGTAYLPIHLHNVLGIGEEGRRVEDLPPQPIGLNGVGIGS